jgi:thioredoxin 1
MADVPEVNDSNFSKSIASGVTLVDFSATWCGPCKMMAPILTQVAQSMKGKANVVMLDIDKNQQTTADFNVMSVPTLILFKDGEEKERVVGVKDANSLIKMINAAL